MEKRNDKLSCAELVRSFLKGTCSAFGVLYSRYDDFIRKSCFKRTRNEETAEDLMQETFSKALGKLHQFKARKGQKSFKKWIWTISLSVFIDHVRHSGKESEVIKAAFEKGNIHSSKEPGPHKRLQQKEQSEILLKAINDLPELPRVCFVSFHFDDPPQEDICETYNLTKNQYYYHKDIAERILEGKLRKLL